MDAKRRISRDGCRTKDIDEGRLAKGFLRRMDGLGEGRRGKRLKIGGQASKNDCQLNYAINIIFLYNFLLSTFHLRILKRD